MSVRSKCASFPLNTVSGLILYNTVLLPVQHATAALCFQVRTD